MTSIDDIPIESDKPKKHGLGPGQYVGVVISVIALGVSLISLWQSHRHSVLEGELSRPLLEISDVSFNPVTTVDSLDGLLPTKLSFSVKNIGHLAAFMTTGDVYPFTRRQDPTDPLSPCYNQSKLSVLSLLYGTEVPPGESTRASIDVRLEPICLDIGRPLSIAVNLNYYDRINNEYSQVIYVDGVKIEKQVGRSP